MTHKTPIAIPHREQLILRGIWLDADPDCHAAVDINYGRWLGHPPSRSDSACMSRSLTWLEGRGLVQRVMYIPMARRAGGCRAAWQHGDSRQRRVRLTDAGRAAASALQPQPQPPPKWPDEVIELMPLCIDLPRHGGDADQ